MMASRPDTDLDRLLEMSIDLLGIGDAAGRLHRVSRSFVRTLGHSEVELLARPWAEWVHPDDMAATVTAAEELGRGAAVIGFTNRWRCADGSYRWLDWLVSPHDGLWYAVARDVTERRSEVGGMAAQGRSVQTAKLAALGQMVAVVAHVANNMAVLERDLGLMNDLLALHAEAVPALDAAAPELAARIRAAAEDMDLAYVQQNLAKVLARSRDGLERIQQRVEDLRDFARLDEGERQH